jgi:flagellar hook-associated protein 1
MPGTGLFGALDASISGMFSSRMATQVATHNIANANTPGYSRQSLRVSSAVPLITTFGAIGRGTVIGSIERAQSDFLQAQLVQQNAIFGNYAELDSALSSVEDILGSTDNDRVGDALSEFFASYSDLATPPMSEGKRQAVVSQAQKLALQFREIDLALNALERDNRAAVGTSVDEVNSLLERVALLNSQVVAASSRGGEPNDLIDQRGQLLDELSNLTRFDLNERTDGSVDVSVEGRALVTRGNVNELRMVEETDLNGQVRQTVQFGGRNPITVDFQAGQISGRSKLSNDILPRVRQQLDELARSIADQVNALHRQGVSSGGAGVDLFTGTDASTFEVNQAVVTNPSLVVTGRSGVVGDNELALEIAALAETVVGGETRSLNEQYSTMIVDLATQRSSYRTLAESQGTIVQSTRNRLEGERGVNLDEELANLVLFQRSFEANARVIRIVDEMLDTVVNGMI